MHHLLVIPTTNVSEIHEILQRKPKSKSTINLILLFRKYKKKNNQRDILYDKFKNNKIINNNRLLLLFG